MKALYLVIGLTIVNILLFYSYQETGYYDMAGNYNVYNKGTALINSILAYAVVIPLLSIAISGLGRLVKNYNILKLASRITMLINILLLMTFSYGKVMGLGSPPGPAYEDNIKIQPQLDKKVDEIKAILEEGLQEFEKTQNTIANDSIKDVIKSRVNLILDEVYLYGVEGQISSSQYSSFQSRISNFRELDQLRNLLEENP